MLNRTLLIASTILVAAASPAFAQRVSWNDRADADTGNAPMVRVSIEGPRIFGYGDPVRVRFSVSEDAYVIIARVDGNGHLTLLHPANRRNTLVRARDDQFVRGRHAASTFLATDRMSGGFVFAMASYDPFDLSRLTIRDFDRYVTGTYVGRPARSYIGDPYRVITRFADMVLYDQDSPFDYDVDYYQVDSPQFYSSSGYSSFCSGYGFNSRFQSLTERWDDDFYYGNLSSRNGCNSYDRYCGLFVPYFSYYGMSNGCVGYYGRGQIAGGPTAPPNAPPGTDTTRRVNPWVGDSIARPDTVGGQPGDGRPPQLRGGLQDDATQFLIREATQRPAVVDYDDGDRVFSIPGRALPPNLRRNREGASPAGTTPVEPGSRTPATAGNEEIRWVRPPRGVEREAAGDGAVPRQPRRADAEGARDAGGGRRADIDRERLPNTRNDPPPRAAAPARNDGPRFDSPPPSRTGPDIRYSPPPPRSEPTRSEPSRAQPPRAEPRSEPSRPEPVRSEPVRVERRDPPPAPRAPPVREPPAEKKPDVPRN